MKINGNADHSVNGILPLNPDLQITEIPPAQLPPISSCVCASFTASIHLRVAKQFLSDSGIGVV